MRKKKLHWDFSEFLLGGGADEKKKNFKQILRIIRFFL